MKSRIVDHVTFSVCTDPQ